MAVVMGIDPSLTSTGYVVLETGTVRHLRESGAITFPKLSGMARVVAIEEILLAVLKRNCPNVVYIEGYSFGSTGKAVFQMGELGGVLRRMLYKMEGSGIVWTEIPPSTLKKFCTGKGNSKKEDMKLHAYKKWGVEFKTNDETDAYALAKMAEQEVS